MEEPRADAGQPLGDNESMTRMHRGFASISRHRTAFSSFPHLVCGHRYAKALEEGAATSPSKARALLPSLEQDMLDQPSAG